MMFSLPVKKEAMKNTIFTMLCALMGSGIVAQTSLQQKLIDEINSITEEINHNPDLYVERSKAIFILNATEPGQKWVPYTLEDAISDINCAIEMNPDDASLYSLRAEYKRDIYLDRSGAVKDMNLAIALEPDNPQWYLQRANYKNLTRGCFDYQQCADLLDYRCEAIVREVCTDLVSSR
jgi:hypothetical protein